MRLLPLLLLLAAGALAAAEVRVELRPSSTVAAREVLLGDVADLSGDPEGVAVLGRLPVLGLRGLSPVRLDERRVRAAVGRHAAAWPLVVGGSGLVAPPPRRFSGDELAAAAQAAVDPAGDRLAVQVVRHPGELVVPDLGPGLGLQAEPLDRGASSGEIPVRVVARCQELELGRTLVVLQVRRFRQVVVASVAAVRGQVIAPDGVRLAEVQVDRRHLEALADPGLAVGRVANRDLREGEPVMRWAVEERPAVSAGRPVSLVWRRNGLELATTGDAMASGRIGDRIHVRRGDGQTVSGRIAGDGLVVIGE